MLHWLKSRLTGDYREPSPFPRGAALDSLRYVVLDTELTSLDKRSNRLLSIGAVAMDGMKIRLGEQFYRVVNPGVPVPRETVVVHHLRSEDLQGCEPLAKTLEELRQFVAGAVLVGHFVNIDLEVLWKELGGSRRELANPAIDTARAHQWILLHGHYSEDLPVQLEKLDLPTLLKFYGLELHAAHHALSDAFTTAQVWQRMIPKLKANRVGNLGDLLKIAGV